MRAGGMGKICFGVNGLSGNEVDYLSFFIFDHFSSLVGVNCRVPFFRISSAILSVSTVRKAFSLIFGNFGAFVASEKMISAAKTSGLEEALPLR
jgi:hypothetical protein